MYGKYTVEQFAKIATTFTPAQLNQSEKNLLNGINFIGQDDAEIRSYLERLYQIVQERKVGAATNKGPASHSVH